MSRVLALVAAATLGLAVVAVSVFAGDDTTILVPPPESVAEQFVREMVAGRYDRAIEYVEPSSGISLTTIRLFGDNLRGRAGAIANVEGEPGAITGERSTASAQISTERLGEVTLRASLVRRNGVWKIVDWR